MGAGGLAALFHPPVPCVGVRHGGGALQKEQVPRSPKQTWLFPCCCPGCGVEKGHRFCCRHMQNGCAPVNALSPSLQGEPGPMAPKGEWPFSSPWDPRLFRRAGAWAACARCAAQGQRQEQSRSPWGADGLLMVPTVPKASYPPARAQPLHPQGAFLGTHLLTLPNLGTSSPAGQRSRKKRAQLKADPEALTPEVRNFGAHMAPAGSGGCSVPRVLLRLLPDSQWGSYLQFLIVWQSKHTSAAKPWL